ncbi:CD1375 family protein [Psychrobacillus sp. FSL K6-1267]
MVTLYADLIELGLRVLENPSEGEIAVPSFLREGVRKELVKREAIM